MKTTSSLLATYTVDGKTVMQFITWVMTLDARCTRIALHSFTFSLLFSQFLHAENGHIFLKYKLAVIR